MKIHTIDELRSIVRSVEGQHLARQAKAYQKILDSDTTAEVKHQACWHLVRVALEDNNEDVAVKYAYKIMEYKLPAGDSLLVNAVSKLFLHNPHLESLDELIDHALIEARTDRIHSRGGYYVAEALALKCLVANAHGRDYQPFLRDLCLHLIWQYVQNEFVEMALSLPAIKAEE